VNAEKYSHMLVVVVVVVAMAVTIMCIVLYCCSCPTGQLLHLPAQGSPVKTEQKFVAIFSSPTTNVLTSLLTTDLKKSVQPAFKSTQLLKQVTEL
jgi:hypothetical protein